jgi:hypothetical protein
MDEYLLGLKQSSKRSKREAIDNWNDGIVNDANKVLSINNQSYLGLQPKVVSAEFLHPFRKRSKTISKNTLALSQTSQDKNILKKNSGVLSGVLLSLPSENNILEEIKENHTNENVESTPMGTVPIFNESQQISVAYIGQQGNSNQSEQSSKIFQNPMMHKVKNKKVFGDLIRWKMGPLLGYGVFGDVVQAFNLANGEILAVKRLLLQKNIGEFNNEAISALKTEINVLRQVDHPFIIKYIGSEIIKDHF